MRVQSKFRWPLVMAILGVAVVGCAGTDVGATEDGQGAVVAVSATGGPAGTIDRSDGAIDGFGVAAGPVDEHPAAAAIREMAKKALAVFADTDLTADERQARFRRLMAQGVDVEPIARFVLGRYWRTATPEQRQAYLKVYTDFIVTSFSQKLGGVVIKRFDVTGAKPAGHGQFLVSSIVQRGGGDPVRAIWRVRERNGSYRIVDLMVQGISLAVTQRQEFASVIRASGGIDGLISKLREMTAAAV